MTRRIRPPVSDFRRMAADASAQEPTSVSEEEPERREPQEPSAPPVINRFEIKPPVAVRGDELLLTWDVADATTVEISDLGQQPPAGTARLTATDSRRYDLRASNAAGEVHAATDRVQVLEVPVVTSLRVPVPDVRLSLDLPLELAGRPPLLARAGTRLPGLELPRLPATGLAAPPRPALESLDLAVPLPSLPGLLPPAPSALALEHGQNRGGRVRRWMRRLRAGAGHRSDRSAAPARNASSA